jgi:hypothetical protein
MRTGPLFCTLVITIISLFALTPVIAQETPTLDISVMSATINPRTSEVTISGTVTCSQPFDFVDIEVGLSQRVGDEFIAGTGYVEGCGSFSTTFPTDEPTNEGRGFRPGRAIVSISAVAYTEECYRCATDFESRTVLLRPAK